MRYWPQLDLPPYSYVTRQWPHPLGDPDGHRFLNQTIDDHPLVPQRWQECATYCYAIDLFHAGYYWEAHEQWERCWQLARTDVVLADFLKALIKLAAAGVKARELNGAGVQRHASRAIALFLAVKKESHMVDMAGLDLDQLTLHARWTVAHFETCLTQGRDAQGARVAIVFPWRLMEGSSENPPAATVK